MLLRKFYKRLSLNLMGFLLSELNTYPPSEDGHYFIICIQNKRIL